MAATRILLRTSRPNLGLRLPSMSNNLTLLSTAKIRNILGKDWPDDREKRLVGVGGGDKKLSVAVKAATSEIIIANEVLDLSSLVTKVAGTALMMLKVATKTRPWALYAQMFIERSIVDCRFFTLFAVAGSLLGSVLCFMEGCFFIVESYFQYFHAISQRTDQGHVIHLLIEAIDMFLVGTALLVFGMGLYVMFVGSKGKSSQHPASNLFGLFNLKALPRWACMQSVTEAKCKIGHAVIMIMQVGVLDKFKSIPLVTGLDLACFAGAIFVSSACLFLLSRLSMGGATVSDR